MSLEIRKANESDLEFLVKSSIEMAFETEGK